MLQKIVIIAFFLVGGLFATIFEDTYRQPDNTPVQGAKPSDITKVKPVDRTASNQSATKPTTSGTIKSSLNKSESRTTQIVAAPVMVYPEKMISKTEFTVNNKTYPLRRYKASAMPNDPSAQQWWVDQTGLPAAWDYGDGTNVKIAVIDTGFALKHEDLSGRWLINNGEVGVTTQEAASRLNCTDQGIPLDMSCNNIDNDLDGIVSNESGPTTRENPSWLNCTDRLLVPDKSCNGLDNDNDGHPSDYSGWDFNAWDANVQAGEINPLGEAAFHGTAVAGTAAATGNNGVGIAGVSWGAKILPIQALSDEGSGNTISVARAIRYAADRQVDIINLSLGSSQEDPYLREAIGYAISKGVVVVAAAGNDGASSLSYPASYPEVVAVGASNSTGSVASFSNTGNSLDIIAPGSGMLLPSWSASAQTKGYRSNLAGTSFAAPYISGLLANARAKQPQATWGQLTSKLYQTADHKTMTPSAPRTNSMGFGFVRADAYMALVSTIFTQPIKYSFPTDNTNVLGAPYVNHCNASQYPTASFYEINNGSSVFYSMSHLTAHLETTRGSVVNNKGYVCVGLPTDKEDIIRMIDPAREFSNVSKK